jgi:hypothetical protein
MEGIVPPANEPFARTQGWALAYVREQIARAQRLLNRSFDKGCPSGLAGGWCVYCQMSLQWIASLTFVH